VVWVEREIRLASEADVTKGLPHKFKAFFAQLLDKYLQYRRQVVLTQIAPPTRESVEAYPDIRHELEKPCRLYLGDIYRSSQICMVTPLRDGMNPRHGALLQSVLLSGSPAIVQG